MTNVSKNRPIERTKDNKAALPNTSAVTSEDGQLLDLPLDCCGLDEYDSHVAVLAQRVGCAAFLLIITAYLFCFSLVYMRSLTPLPSLTAITGLLLAGRAAIEHDLFVLSTQHIYGRRSEEDRLSSQAALRQRSVAAILCIIVGAFLWVILAALNLPARGALAACPFIACAIALMTTTIVISRLYDYESFNERQEQRLSALEAACEKDTFSDEPLIKYSSIHTRVPRIIKAFAIATICSVLMWVFGKYLYDTYAYPLMIVGDIMCYCFWLPLIYPCMHLVMA